MSSFPVSAALTKKSGSNFLAAFLFLDPRQKEAMQVLYALSRVLDDLVDEAQDPQQAAIAIGVWRQKIHDLYGGAETSEAILQEYQVVARSFGLRQEYLLDLVAGMEMDLVKHRYGNFVELEKYCYHVAGTVGLLCNQIFGFDHERARAYAIALGTAFQLTNIIRDVGVDAAKGRIYLPQDELRQFAYSEEELMSARGGGNFIRLMEFQAERAEGYFARARDLLTVAEHKKLVTTTVMTKVYHQLLRKIRRQQYPVLQGKVSLSRWEKIKILSSTYLMTKLGR